MLGPLDKFSEEELIEYAQTLLKQAQNKLKDEDPDVEAACWRLADALGALSKAAALGTAGVHEFTGLGYRLEAKGNDNT